MKWYVSIPTGYIDMPLFGGRTQVNHGYSVSAATREEAAKVALDRHWSEAPGSPAKGKPRVERIMRYEVTLRGRADARRRETVVFDSTGGRRDTSIANEAVDRLYRSDSGRAFRPTARDAVVVCKGQAA